MDGATVIECNMYGGFRDEVRNDDLSDKKQ
jgi:hypothetical protein